jgi:hypothetical protein
MFKNMRIVFSNHARIKIAQRKISRSYVIRTLSSPNFIRYNLSGHHNFYRKFTKLYLKVVAKKLNGSTIAITVHWVAKVPNK